MRYFSLFFLTLLGTALAGEPQYPLWDGTESVAEYSKKVNLPPTQSLDLGNGVKLELVLIPAGKFIMGTPEPVPVDEEGFRKKIITGQVLLAVSGCVLLVLLAFIFIKVVRKRQRPKFSLLWLMGVSATAGIVVLSGFHWRQSAQGLKKAQAEFKVAKFRFDTADQSEEPGHPVTLTEPFYMGKYTVTQEQYQAVIGTNPSQFKNKDNPVEQVSWNDAQVFCKNMGDLTHQAVRLPTEAEWEFSCRAGMTTEYHSGDTEADLERVAWYIANSNRTTHPVGRKEPNAFGLYDMHGNVWQWCADFFGKDYYGKSVAVNPQGATQGSYRVLRGGHWNDFPVFCRSSYRFTYPPDYRIGGLGFRVVVEPEFKAP